MLHGALSRDPPNIKSAQSVLAFGSREDQEALVRRNERLEFSGARIDGLAEVLHCSVLSLRQRRAPDVYGPSWTLPNALVLYSQRAKQPGDKIRSNCSPHRLLKDRGDPISCCQEGNRTYHTLDGKRLVFRTYAKQCTLADGKSKGCEGKECVYGPCGGKIDWRVTTDEVHIFKPDSNPEKCGWAVQNVRTCEGCDFPIGENRSDPEPFTNQKEYLGVKATCPFTGCGKRGDPTR